MDNNENNNNNEYSNEEETNLPQKYDPAGDFKKKIISRFYNAVLFVQHCLNDITNYLNIVPNLLPN